MLRVPDQDPEEDLLRDNLRLKGLLADFNEKARDPRAPVGPLLRLLLGSLRLHFTIEERLCFPALQSLHSGDVRRRVEEARRRQEAILRACDRAESEEDPARRMTMKAVSAQLETYLEFEEQILFPWLSSLAEVTLHEMSLEIQELMGKGGRYR